VIRLTWVLALITGVAAMALGLVYSSTAPKIEVQQKIANQIARQTALPEAACGVFVRVGQDGFEYFRGYGNPDTTELVGYTVEAAGQGYSSVIKTVVGVDRSGRITGMKITSQAETPGLGTRIEEVKSTRSVLDALKEIAGKGSKEHVAVEVATPDGSTRCLDIAVRIEPLCGDVESLISAGDTAGTVAAAARAFALGPDDSTFMFAETGRAFRVAQQALEELRKRTTPWFQQQFMGKAYGDLRVTTQETDRHIQAITGATISSVAVTESVREAIQHLEEVLGGFEEEQ
jgi:electron transport complex protein RnfG